MTNNNLNIYFIVYNKLTNKTISKHNSKIEALIEATKLKKKGIDIGISFFYFHEIWKNFDYSICGKIPLHILYKERALQLRDKYNYLILKYSGGSDSHNILMTFLKNNIKLDAIQINWPVIAKEKNLYQPDNTSNDSYNELSEWDYTIKPDIEWLKKNHPEIKIHIDDWFSDLIDEKLNFDDRKIEKQSHYLNLPSFYRMQNYSDFEKKLIDNEINVGFIHGADKPNLYIDEKNTNRVGFRFIDWPLQNIVSYNNKGGEYFYWSPDFPILAVEMAYQSFLYYKHNKDKQWLLYSLSKFENKTKEESLCIVDEIPNIKNEIYKKILYPYWDSNRFQAKKDIKILAQVKNGKPQDWIFWKNKELNFIQNKWNYYVNSYINNVDYSFLNLDDNNNIVCFKPTYSQIYGGSWLLN